MEYRYALRELDQLREQYVPSVLVTRSSDPSSRDTFGSDAVHILAGDFNMDMRKIGGIHFPGLDGRVHPFGLGRAEDPHVNRTNTAYGSPRMYDFILSSGMSDHTAHTFVMDAGKFRKSPHSVCISDHLPIAWYIV